MMFLSLGSSYRLFDLGKGLLDSAGLDVNDKLDVLVRGTDLGPGPQRWYLWNNEKRTVIKLPAGWRSIEPRRLSSYGDVVGQGVLADGSTVAFVLKGGKPNILALPVGLADATANSINASGRIVGSALSLTITLGGPPHYVAMIWNSITAKGIAIDSSKLTELRSINDHGEAVGPQLVAPGVTNVLIWANGEARYVKLPYSVVEVAANNNLSVIVGTIAARKNRAFRYRGKVFSLLPLLKGTVSSSAFDINDAGLIVGSCETASGKRIASIWSPRGTVRALSTLVPARGGWQFTEALAINDRGDIVGEGRRNGKPRAFLLKKMRPK